MKNNLLSPIIPQILAVVNIRGGYPEKFVSHFGQGSAEGKKQPQLLLRLSVSKKVSQSLPPIAANKVKTVFCQGTYLAENTSQAASVEFVPRRGTNYARSRLQKTCRKAPKGFFDSLSRSFGCG